MVKLGIVLLAAAFCTMAACSQVSTESSAAKRAERLNASKSEARELVGMERFQEAVSVLEPLSKEASGDPQVFVMLGESYRELERYDEAIHSYETAIRLAYHDYHAHLKLANLLMDRGKTGRALTEYELAAQLGKNDPVTRYNYGLALHEMGRNEMALDEWKAAYQLESGNPNYAEAMGIGLTDSDPTEAIEYFETAAELGAEGAGYYNNYGLALQNAGDHAGAARRFRRAVGLEPANEMYRYSLAAAYMNMGAYREALAEWEALVERYGPRWSYTVYRGEALLERGRYAEAIETVAAIVAEYESGTLESDGNRLDRTPPRLADALQVLAMSHRGLGHKSQALSYIERAVELDPDNVTHLNNYGVILAENGSIDRAKAQWRRVLEIDADNVTAVKNLSVIDP
jgi:tetratricopeptide (TPR) repeat protein